MNEKELSRYLEEKAEINRALDRWWRKLLKGEARRIAFNIQQPKPEKLDAQSRPVA